MAMKDIETMPLRCPPGTNPQSHSQGIKRQVRLRSTHRLGELSKSSLSEVTEVSAMNEFRRLMMQNRKKQNEFFLRTQQSKLSSSRSVPSSASSLQSNNVPSSSSRILLDDDLSYQHQQEINSSETQGSSADKSRRTKLPSPTKEDLVRSADAKLTKYSVSFDARSLNSDISGFQNSLTKKELDTQLRRCLNINLKRKELDALFEKMDADKSNAIDGVEFIRYFFALGTEARWQQHMERVRRLAKQAEHEKKKKIEEEKKVKEWEASQIADSFTNEDTESVMKKLAEAALKWDPGDRIEALYIAGFQAHLTPFQFKMQIDKSFGLKLTNAELAAVIAAFKTREGEYCIDGHLFLIKFQALRSRAIDQYYQSLVGNKNAKEKTLREGLNGAEFYLNIPLGR